MADRIGQLHLGEIVDLAVEAFTDAANRARVSLDRLGLQAFELEVLQVSLVLPVEVRRRCGVHACPHDVV
jgi:hypothetical protein